MNFDEFIGIRRCDEDIETGRRMTHREIYARAIDRFGGLDAVWDYVPYKDVAWLQEKAREDPFFNNTDMTPWDFASGFICFQGDIRCTGSGLWHLYRKHGITSASNAQGVALLKEAARLMCERKREREDMFALKINTGNAAFHSDEFQDENGNNCLDPYACELRRLLDEVKKQLIYGRFSGKLIDINGNRVGEWSLD